MLKKRFVRKKIIFISIILSMSIIGVGYAAWNDDTKIDLLLTTGFINPVFLLENEKIEYGDENLILSLSDDRHTLYIAGEVYPSYNEELTIKIVDEGSIPSVLNDLHENDDDISALNVFSDLNISNDCIESFKLNISPNSEYPGIIQDDAYSGLNDEISKFEREIEILREEIKLYDREENYDFEYILLFEQGL
ncbi:MAG: hypothetical protein WBJ13_14330 [Sedimentibacter sp.]